MNINWASGRTHTFSGGHEGGWHWKWPTRPRRPLWLGRLGSESWRWPPQASSSAKAPCSEPCTSPAPPSGRSPSSSSSSWPTYQPKQEMLFQISSLNTYLVLQLVQLSLVGHVHRGCCDELIVNWGQRV